MPTRYRKADKSEQQEEQEHLIPQYSPWERPPLPIEYELGIYARQSTPGQVKYHVQSNEMQTEDLVEYAKSLGWTEDKITLFTQDMARSGRLKIVDREGMLTLTEMIRQGIIKAVLAAKEDRLFRDETALEYNTFIQVCKQHNCLVIVPPFTIYNFANKRDVKEFRYQCEKAADFLDDYVERLKALRERAILQGYYGGGYIPIGATIDRRKTITNENGAVVPNPNYKKYIRYEPHAEVIDWCLERFYQTHNLNGIVREAERLGKRFPEFTADVDPRSRRIAAKHAEDEQGGYLITIALLESVFTNVFYVGHLVKNGQVIRENDHAPIVKNLTHFLYAFNHVSTHTTDGERREDKPAKRFLREESDEATLLKYVVASDKTRQTFVKHRANADEDGSKWAYSVVRVRPNGIREHVGEINAQLIDECFIEWFRQKIARLKAHTDYSAEIQMERAKREARRANLQTTLEVIREQRANIRACLVTGEIEPGVKVEPDTRIELLKDDSKLAAKQREIEAELNGKPAATPAESKSLRYKHLVLEHGDYWEGYPIGEKHKFLESVIKEVEISYAAPHWIEIKITWINPEWGIDIGYLWYKKSKSNPTYTEAELEIIRKLYPAATQREILEALPTRTWQSIIRQAYLLKLSRKYQRRNDAILPFWSMADIAFAEEKRIDTSNMMLDKFICWSERAQMGSSSTGSAPSARRR
jgi:DNA invertase Pin-like site-specific DNA recombinase